MSFSDNIRRFRTDLGMTQEQLAAEVGISSQAVSKWENAESMPDPALLPEIADALGVTIDELYGHTPATADPVHRALAAQFAGKKPEESITLLFDTVLSAFHSVFGESPVLSLKGERENHAKGTDLDSRKFDIVVTDRRLASDSGLAHAYESKYFPYAAILLEPEDGWHTLLESELSWNFIRAMGDEDVMNCVRYFLARNASVEMEASLLLKKAGCDPARKDEIFRHLENARIASLENIEINGQSREIAVHYPGHMARKILPFFAAAYASATLNFGNGRGEGHMERAIL